MMSAIQLSADEFTDGLTNTRALSGHGSAAGNARAPYYACGSGVSARALRRRTCGGCPKARRNARRRSAAASGHSVPKAEIRRTRTHHANAAARYVRCLGKTGRSYGWLNACS
jgi:hypothetical protein